MLHLQEFFKKLTQGHDQNSGDQISNSVNCIPRKSRNDPSKCLLKAQSKHQGLSGCIERSESKAVKTTHNRVNNAFDSFGYISRKRHSYSPKYSPNIKIWDPPHRKSGIQSVQHNVNVNWDQSFLAKDHRIGYRKHSEQVNVWKNLHQDF